MGTFALVLLDAVPVDGTAGTWSLQGGAATAKEAVQIDDAKTATIDLAQVNALDTFLNCSNSTLTVYLDANPIPQGFPGGFTVTSAKIVVIGTSAAGAFDPALLTLIYNGVDLYTYTKALINAGPIEHALDISDYTTLANFLGRAFGARIAAGNFSTRQIVFDVFRIEGTYDISAYQWQIEDEEVPVKIGDLVRITGLSGLGGVSGANFIYNPGSGNQTCYIPYTEFYYLSPTEIAFYVPFCLGSFTGTASIYLIGDGTEFSGSSYAGALEILFEDGSGIYKIVKNKATDTKYDPERNGESDEVKIPNPFAAPGFVNG